MITPWVLDARRSTGMMMIGCRFPEKSGELAGDNLRRSEAQKGFGCIGLRLEGTADHEVVGTARRHGHRPR